MTKKDKKKLDFSGGLQFEIKKGLYINQENYEDFIKMYNLALEREKPNFPFRNDDGVLFKVETDFVSFVLKTLSNTSLEGIKEKEEKHTERQQEQEKQELKLAIQQHEEEKEEGFFKETTPEEDAIRNYRRTLYDKHIKNK